MSKDEKEKLESLEEFFWKIKEGETKCIKIKEKFEECKKFENKNCENFEIKHGACILATINKKISSCMPRTIFIPNIDNTELTSILTCLEINDEEQIEMEKKWELINEELKDPKIFYPHEKNIQDTQYNILDTDEIDDLQNKVDNFKLSNYCNEEVKQQNDCYNRMVSIILK
jgi:hypothetical protein